MQRLVQEGIVLSCVVGSESETSTITTDLTSNKTLFYEYPNSSLMVECHSDPLCHAVWDAGAHEGCLTSSIHLAQVGKAPDVAQAHGKPDACQKVLDFVVPLGTLLCLGGLSWSLIRLRRPGVLRDARLLCHFFASSKHVCPQFPEHKAYLHTLCSGFF